MSYLFQGYIYRQLQIFIRFSELCQFVYIGTLFKKACGLKMTDQSQIKIVSTLLFSQVCTKPYKTFWPKHATAKRKVHKHYIWHLIRDQASKREYFKDIESDKFDIHTERSVNSVTLSVWKKTGNFHSKNAHFGIKFLLFWNSCITGWDLILFWNRSHHLFHLEKNRSSTLEIEMY